EEALGERFDLLAGDLRDALISCSAAQEVDAGLWLYRNQQDPEHEVGETVLLQYPLWEEHGVTVLRRLLQRRLADRRPEDPYPDWPRVHSMLSHYYREERPDDIAEAYHMLCEGHLYRVAEHLERWLKDQSIDGEQWVHRLRRVAHAPLRKQLKEPYFDGLLDAMGEQLAGTDPAPTTRNCLKLVSPRRFLNDPDVFRTTELHATCQQTLTELAPEICRERQSRRLGEAGQLSNLCGLYWYRRAPQEETNHDRPKPRHPRRGTPSGMGRERTREKTHQVTQAVRTGPCGVFRTDPDRRRDPPVGGASLRRLRQRGAFDRRPVCGDHRRGPHLPRVLHRGAEPHRRGE